MPREPRKLTTAERAELCRRVDLPALFSAHGVEVRRNGSAYLCKLRPDERTPSCHIFPPGHKGAAAWSWYDFGPGKGGDALGYLVDERGMSFVDAVAELCRLAGWTPPGLGKDAAGYTAGPQKADLAPQVPPTPPPAGPAGMTTSEQVRAANAFLSTLLAVCPDAAAQGDAYLAGRGCLPPGLEGNAGYVLPAESCADLLERLAAGPAADLLVRAGLVKPAGDGKPMRLAWWDRVALLPCYDGAGRLVYLVGRRLNWSAGDACGKYINQGTAGGACRWPFNLPALYHAAGRLPNWPVRPAPDLAGDLLLVEGPLDALGASVLGWPAVAMLSRPQAHNYLDRDGAMVKMLTPHLPALRDLRRVHVVPDADPGAKGAEGEALAARLVGWLRAAGCRTDVSRLCDLCPDAPPECKDLADVAKTKGSAP